MSDAPERIWAWSFFKWSEGWGGYARQENRHALDNRERDTGAEYIRLDLHTADIAIRDMRIAELEAQRDEAIALCKKAQKGHNVALDLAENALTNLRELVAKNAHSMTKTQEADVKVCPICDIADCHHIRGQNAVNLP